VNGSGKPPPTGGDSTKPPFLNASAYFTYPMTSSARSHSTPTSGRKSLASTVPTAGTPPLLPAGIGANGWKLVAFAPTRNATSAGNRPFFVAS
jgi:hypothetical protein